jgi:glucokinase
MRDELGMRRLLVVNDPTATAIGVEAILDGVFVFVRPCNVDKDHHAHHAISARLRES